MPAARELPSGPVETFNRESLPSVFAHMGLYEGSPRYCYVTLEIEVGISSNVSVVEFRTFVLRVHKKVGITNHRNIESCGGSSDKSAVCAVTWVRHFTNPRNQENRCFRRLGNGILKDEFSIYT